MRKTQSIINFDRFIIMTAFSTLKALQFYAEATKLVIVLLKCRQI